MKEGQEDYIAEQDESLAYSMARDKNGIEMDTQTERVLAALNENRKSLGWVPHSMKQYHM